MRVNVTYSTRGFDAIVGGTAERPIYLRFGFRHEMTREAAGRYVMDCVTRMFGENLDNVQFGPTEA